MLGHSFKMGSALDGGNNIPESHVVTSEPRLLRLKGDPQQTVVVRPQVVMFSCFFLLEPPSLPQGFWSPREICLGGFPKPWSCFCWLSLRPSAMWRGGRDAYVSSASWVRKYNILFGHPKLQTSSKMKQSNLSDNLRSAFKVWSLQDREF